uniref:Uncharacterized protein n=1 Tax=Rhizophora mucronata TaxID=61149 RepID=A0A2P2PG90_RHIMU
MDSGYLKDSMCLFLIGTS